MPRKRWFAACALALVCGHSAAHGERHGAPTDAAPKEQKPWGIAGNAQPGLRTIRIVMEDRMRFVPATIDVKQGETVRLVVSNAGALMHELVIGTRQELEQHAALMKKFPKMEHDEPYMVHVPPGRTGEIVWTFNRAGEFQFACLVAGHYEAGMTGTIKVHRPAPEGSAKPR